MKIATKDFRQMQPGYPITAPTDPYYMSLTAQLGAAWDKWGGLSTLNDDTRARVTLATVGYFQDIVADAGLWRTFTDQHRRKFGKPLPLSHIDDDYTDFELNRDDIRFLIAYIANGEHAHLGLPHIDPDNPEVAALADLFFNLLDSVYETAPTPVDYLLLAGLDLNNPQETEQAYNLTYWLFWNSYIMRPTMLAATRTILDDVRALIDRHGNDAEPHVADLHDHVMAKFPCGPIPMPIGQWIQLIINPPED